MLFCYAYRSMPYQLSSESFLLTANREWVETPTARHLSPSAKREHELEVSTRSLSAEVWVTHGRAGGKIVDSVGLMDTRRTWSIKSTIQESY